MPDSKRTAAAAAPTEAGVLATVNGPTLVQLWGTDGRAIYVEAAEADARVAEGYRREKPDPAALAAELVIYFDTAQRAIADFWSGVKEDEEIDPHDEAQYAVAEQAMSLLVDTYGRFREQCLAAYPLVEGDPEQAIVDGEAVNFDPSQVLMQHPTEGVRGVPAAEVEQRLKYQWVEVARGSAASDR